MTAFGCAKKYLAPWMLLLFVCFAMLAHGADEKEEELPAMPKPGLGGVETPGLLDKHLDGALKDVEEIVFCMRGSAREWHFFATTGYDCADPSREWFSLGPGALMAMNLRTKEVRTILDDPKGAVRSPCVSYDGQRILFSWRRDESKVFHLYEINADGTGLRQITDGAFDDVEPVYVPDGGIVFSSARCKRFVPCFRSQVQMLYHCELDGTGIRALSAGQENELTPWVLPDGRVIYMRWEYVERQVRTYHHLWTIRPDGTNEMVYFGNNSKSYVSVPGSVVIMDAKPIPGTNSVVAVSHNKHGGRNYTGAVVVIDPSEGPDEWDNLLNITSDPRTDLPDARKWRDPYPLSRDCFILALENAIYIMDGKGNFEKIFEGPAMLHEPRPLTARPRETELPSMVDPSNPKATCMIADVTIGRNMEGIDPGDVKKMMILEVLPKPISVSGGVRRFHGNGSNLKRIIGTVPVEPDGSVHFEAPAMRALMFVLLDEKDRAIKRMRSFTTFMPGEQTSCIGCHERRTLITAPQRQTVMALERYPSKPELPVGSPPYGIVDYMRDLQPILDKHCVKCHNPLSGNLNFSGGVMPDFIHGYKELSRITPLGGQSRGNDPPYKFGSGNSKLLDMLEAGHHKVQLSEAEFNMFRLWIDTGMWMTGTHANMMWKDRCGFAASDNPKGVENYKAVISGDILQRRCDSCHEPQMSKKFGKRRKQIIDNDNLDLTNVEKSLLLLAPLAKDAGGLGLCRDKESVEAGKGKVFATKSDPDYVTLKKEIEQIREIAFPGGFHWKPGFKPVDMYIREMKRYGVLPEEFDPDTPLDPWKTDQQYYELFYPEHEAGLASGK